MINLTASLQIQSTKSPVIFQSNLSYRCLPVFLYLQGLFLSNLIFRFYGDSSHSYSTSYQTSDQFFPEYSPVSLPCFNFILHGHRLFLSLRLCSPSIWCLATSLNLV